MAVVKKVWYCATQRHSIQIPVLDPETHEKVYKKDWQGNIAFSRNKPVLMTEPVLFETISKDHTKGCYCALEVISDKNGKFTPRQKLIIDHLENKDPDVMTEAQWKKSRNKEAFEKGMEIERLKNELKVKDKALEMARENAAALEKAAAKKDK